MRATIRHFSISIVTMSRKNKRVSDPPAGDSWYGVKLLTFLKGGRGGRGGGGRGGGGRGRDNNDRRPYQSYPEVPKENTKLQSYYDSLLEYPDEEKEQFWAALRRELPNSFRFCGSKGHALTVKGLLETRYIPDITKITTFDGQLVDPPKPVPWYPDSLAWWMTTPKNIIRKFPPFSAFQKFLVSETSVGNISRQEVVSMIPPLLMDLQPGMTVLDMCAAPGSKAAQLLEMVHRGEEARIRKVIEGFGADESPAAEDDGSAELSADPSDDGRATGLLVANDGDYKRSHLLIHQLKRLSSPNMIVTNHDATMYPQLRVNNPEDSTQNTYLKFDRILADVPCSGDGTLRKNVNLWKDWQPGSALGLHLTQVRILVRALQILKPGGRMVYSTCSMNPVENESVVSAAIERCGGPDKVEIVDCSDQLVGLKRVPGLKKWKIMDKACRTWNNWDEVLEFTKKTEDGLVPGRLAESMFPQLEDSCAYDLPLDRCMRVYGHLQDTGGFFITVLRKKTEFKAKPEKPGPNEATIRASAESAKRRRNEEEQEDEKEAKKPKTETEGDNPAVETAVDADIVIPDAEPEVKVEEPTQEEPTKDSTNGGEPEVATIDKIEAEPAEGTEQPATETSTPAVQTPASGNVEQELKKKSSGSFEEPFKYLSPDHEVIQGVSKFYGISERFPSDRFLVRNALGQPAKAIYYTSALVRDILVSNEGRGVKFVHGGVKMFVKQDSPSADVCRWRIQSEGMPILHGYVDSQQVVVLKKKETLKKLLIEMFPVIGDEAWRNLDEIGEQVRDMHMGCSVLRVEPDGTDPDFTEHMALPLWKSFKSLNLMLPKEDRMAMLLRIYNDTTPLINMGIAKRRIDGSHLPEEPAAENGSAPEEAAEADAANDEPQEEKIAEDEGDSEIPANGEAPADANGEAPVLVD